MQDDATRRESSEAGLSVLRAAGLSADGLRSLAARGRPLSVGQAMAVATVVRQLAAAGLAVTEVEALVPTLADAAVDAPEVHAAALADLFRRLNARGVSRGEALKQLERAARAPAHAVSGVGAPWGEEQGGSERAAGGTPAAKDKGGRAMTDLRAQGGPGPNGSAEREREREKEKERLDREREKMERERERAEREREKLERERERLDRMQEALEERLAQQEDRLQELEDALEDRMEALDEAAAGLEDLEDIEVHGIEGVREMLDVVSDRLPHLLRGIHETVYAPDRLEATAASYAAFYKKLTESGVPDALAAEITQRHFENLERQVQAEMGAHRGRRGPGDGFDPLGPNFDPLGPAFDPLRRAKRHRQERAADAPCDS